MSEKSNFDANYYNEDYFKTPNGKKYTKPDGTVGAWSYSNPTGDWHGCAPIAKAWKDIFKLNEKSKVLDIGCGRGTFISYLRNIGIEAHGFDFSEWAINNPHPKCHKDWIRVHDATKEFPYGGSPFDLVICLDLMEHLYLEDIDKVINEIYRVSNKWIFLQIATIGGGSGSGIHDNGYILKKGDTIPKELEGCAVAGHVTVQNKQFWINKLMIEKEDIWKLREDKVLEFVSKVPPDVICNWTKNTILVLEKKEQ